MLKLLLLGLCLVFSSLATNHWKPIEDVQTMDDFNMRGMDPSYNHTQVPVKDPLQYANYRIALFAGDFVEDIEIEFPYIFFQSRGAAVDVVIPTEQMESTHLSQLVLCEFIVPSGVVKAITSQEAQHNDYDFIYVAGGVWSSNAVRADSHMVDMLAHQIDIGRPCGFLCSGASLLIDLGYAKSGFKGTGSPAVQADLEQAGMDYLDVPAYANGNILMGRSPQFTDSYDYMVLVDTYFKEHSLRPVNSQTLDTSASWKDSYHRLTEYSEMTKLKLEANYRSKVIPLEHTWMGTYDIESFNIVASIGADINQIKFMLVIAKALNVEAVLYAPGWVGELLGVSDYLLPDYLTEFRPLEDLKPINGSEKLTVTTVVGGFWCSGVVRGDGNLHAHLKSVVENKGVIATVHSGAQVLFNSHLSDGLTMTTPKSLHADATVFGANPVAKSHAARLGDGFVVTTAWESFNDPASFSVAMDNALSGQVL